MLKKKSQGLSINTMVLLALGLIILIILSYLISGRIGIFRKSFDCSAKNGECLEKSSSSPKECPEGKPIKIYTDDCKLVKDNEVAKKGPGQCCIAIV